MIKSAIKEIFDGEKGFRETMIMPKDEEQSAKIYEMHERLKRTLSPRLYELHNKFVFALEEGWCKEIDFYFAEGFKLGLRVGVECMEGV